MTCPHRMDRCLYVCAPACMIFAVHTCIHVCAGYTNGSPTTSLNLSEHDWLALALPQLVVFWDMTKWSLFQQFKSQGQP